MSVLTRNPDFRRLFLAQLAVFGGDWFRTWCPLAVLPHDLTGSGGALVLAADTGSPRCCCRSPVPWSTDRPQEDHGDRELAGIVTIALLFGVRSPGTAWLAPATVAAFAVAKAFYTPAASAALPNLAPCRGSGHRERGRRVGVEGRWRSSAPRSAACAAAAFRPVRVLFTLALVGSAVLVWRIGRPMQADVAMCRHRAPGRRSARVAVASATGPGCSTGRGEVGGRHGQRGADLVPDPRRLVRRRPARHRPAVRRPGWAHRTAQPLRRVVLHRWLLPGLAVSMAAYGLAYLAWPSYWFPRCSSLVVIASRRRWELGDVELRAAAEVPELRGRAFSTDMMLATLAISVSRRSRRARRHRRRLGTRGRLRSVTLLYRSAGGW
jgi:hypothetical protein